MKKPGINYMDLGVEWRDCGPWRSFELDTSGATSEEMRANATISEVDQDGGQLNCYGYEDCANDVARAVDREIHHALGLALLKETAK